MARQRTIKPGFFLNEELAGLDYRVRLLFIGLWTIADRKGRLEDRPVRIKAELFPYEENGDFFVSDYLDILEEKRFLKRYEVNDNNYIQILKFEKHQHPHPNERESNIPPPAEASNNSDTEDNIKCTHEKVVSPHEKVVSAHENKRALITKESRVKKDENSKKNIWEKKKNLNFVKEGKHWSYEKVIKFNYNSITNQADYRLLYKKNNRNNIINIIKKFGLSEKEIENFFDEFGKMNFQEMVILTFSVLGKKIGIVKRNIYLTGNRNKKIKSRLDDGMEIFEVMTAISEQPFLQGKNNHNWVVTLDWLLHNDTNFVKVIERAYLKTKKSKDEELNDEDYGRF